MPPTLNTEQPTLVLYAAVKRTVVAGLPLGQNGDERPPNRGLFAFQGEADFKLMRCRQERRCTSRILSAPCRLPRLSRFRREATKRREGAAAGQAIGDA